MRTDEQRFERIGAVLARVGLSRTSIHRMVKAGTFPKPIPISEGAVAWLSSDVDKWMEDRIAAARGEMIHEAEEAVA